MAEAPTDLDNLELYIDLLLTVGMADRAEREFADRLRAGPDRPDNHYLLGRALTDVRYAREAYENALRLDPDHARSHMGIGAVYAALGQGPDARAAYRHALELDPTLTEAWLGLVRLHGMAGDGAAATRVAEEGLAAVPNDPGLALAVATLVPGRAGAVLPPAVAATPDDAALRAALAAHLLAAGEPAGARDEAIRALAIDPTHAEARRIAMVASELAAGRLTAAQAVQAEAAAGRPRKLDALVEAAPTSLVVRLLRASLHREAGELEAARDHLQAARDVVPIDPEVNGALGQVLLQLGRPGEALTPLTIAAQASPWDAPLQVTLAAALQQTGDTARALDLLTRLADERPLNVVVQGAYAQALVDAGRSEEAYQALKRSLRLLPDPRLLAAFVMVAGESGHHAEAADLLDQLAASSGSDDLAAKAKAMRAQGR